MIGVILESTVNHFMRAVLVLIMLLGMAKPVCASDADFALCKLISEKYHGDVNTDLITGIIKNDLGQINCALEALNVTNHFCH